jgi:cellulose synthase/poly-beta-1,6-N-acetylglucosamine synthase-like glycosyltransferase/peptidoglycan/xylan/chitin deacetylase (PgdA/CDA1 family)/spore germination protein YaaH
MSELSDRGSGGDPVFLDRRGRRAILTNAILVTFWCVAFLGILGIGLALFVTPTLPTLPAPSLATRQVMSTPSAPTRAASEFPLKAGNHRSVPKEAVSAMRFAFYSPYDAGSFTALQRQATHLDAIIPDWLRITQSGAKPSLQSDEGSVPVVRWLRHAAPHVKIFPQLTSRLTVRETGELLGDPKTRTELIEQIFQHLRQNRFKGVSVNLPDLPPSNHRNFVVFLEALGKKLRSGDLELILAVSANVSIQAIRSLSRPCDYVLLKLYEDTISGSETGPIVPQGWFEAQLRVQSLGVERGKLIIGIGSFGYEWSEHGGRRLISVQTAWDLMSRTGATLRFDARTLNPGFRYLDDAGKTRDVWYLDAVTAFNEVKAALATQPAGIAIWRLGLEDPGVWASAGRNRLPDESALSAIAIVEPGYDAFAEASGVVLSAQPGSAGVRTISYNQSVGLIVHQSVADVPKQVVLTTWSPYSSKAVALTFDDGPDPVYTAKILDILAEKSVQATFYAIGMHALAYPELLQRIYKEGHDLGNHSWSHPDLHTSISSARIKSELNGTQRVFEAKLGIRSRLLRPPHMSSNYLRLDSTPELVRTASELGYLFAGYDASPLDFILSADHIVSETISQVESGRQVVLLHDAGGNRQPTVDALPIIIDRLRERGFQLVSTHELIGRSRNELMPAMTGQGIAGRVESQTGVASLGFLLWLQAAIPTVAFATAILGILRILLIIVGALVQKRTAPAPATEWRPEKIAVLVPAYNEEEVICKTVSTLLSSTYRDELEIIVIDDGSRDRTAEVVRQNFGYYDKIKLHRKENGGKASALNYGIDRTDAELIVAIDGDTILMPDAIENLVKHFRDPLVGAVAGNVLVGNQKNLITRFQALEYITSQNLDRRAFELCNAIGVVPGAIGAWRRSSLIEVGGYCTDTLAEDADLTLSIERRGWRVVSEPGARALTEAPETLRAFMKQRFRWTFGMLQVAYKHAKLRSRGCGATLIAIPNIFVFQFGFTLLAPIMDLLLVYAGMAALMGSSHHETLLILVSYWIFFQTIDAAAAAIGIALNGERRPWRLLPLIFLQRFSYRQLLYVVAIRALSTAIKGRLVGWGKLIRTGSVTVPSPPSLNLQPEGSRS